MLSFNGAMNLLKSSCPENVVKHCIMVSDKSFEIAEKIKSQGYDVDIELCRVGGLLHDIGRSKIHDITHGIAGAEILKEHPKLARIALTHIGGGIPKEEAKELGLPYKDFLPVTIEEKIVCYADKLVQGDRFANDSSEEIEKLSKKLGSNHLSIKRIREIENEINKLIKKI